MTKFDEEIMAFVLCQMHGGNIAPLLCEHLADAVEAEEETDKIHRIEAWYLGEQVWTHHVCGECASANGITEETTKMKDDDSLDRLFLMKGRVRPVCPGCFEEWKKKRPANPRTGR